MKTSNLLNGARELLCDSAVHTHQESKEREAEHPGGSLGTAGPGLCKPGQKLGCPEEAIVSSTNAWQCCLVEPWCLGAMPGIKLPVPAKPLQCSLSAVWVVDPGGTGRLPSDLPLVPYYAEVTWICSVIGSWA